MTVRKPSALATSGQPDAGVAGGALDDGAAGLQRAARERIADDEQRGAVLDRLAGIHELGLAENGAAGQFRRLAELDQRRVADGGDNVLLDIHEYSDAPAGACPSNGLGGIAPERSRQGSSGT